MASETTRQKATERKRRQRERELLGKSWGYVELPDELGGFAVAAELLTEQEADMPDKLAKTAGVILAGVVREWLKDSETHKLPREWVAYSGEGAPLSSAEKFAWVQAHGLIGASKQELTAKLIECGLLARWNVPEAEDDEFTE
jgi:hypothetical protein